MGAPVRTRPGKRGWFAGAMTLALGLLGGAMVLCADTPSQLRAANAGGCYCHCEGSRGLGACVKMCDSPRYAASHRWATRCVKPRLQLPAEDHDAGPRYAHPGRAERAANAEPSSTKQKD